MSKPAALAFLAKVPEMMDMAYQRGWATRPETKAPSATKQPATALMAGALLEAGGKIRVKAIRAATGLVEGTVGTKFTRWHRKGWLTHTRADVGHAPFWTLTPAGRKALRKIVNGEKV